MPTPLTFADLKPLHTYRGDDGICRAPDMAPGSARWAVFDDGSRALLFVCPCGCGIVDQINVNKPGGWNWDGDEWHPTLTPSINRDRTCKWHGHLTKGVFVP